MRLSANILCLPPSIIILLASHTTVAESPTEDQSPAQWPKHVRYWPEDPPHRRRDLEALEEHVRRGESPVGVMKMSPDPGEKFYPEYWQYGGELERSRIAEMEPQSESGSLKTRGKEDEARMLANVSMTAPFRAPFALHNENGGEKLRVRAAVGRSAAALATLEKRDFTCPTGTNSCSAIGYPNSCCPAAETCFQIQDTGLGPVGCCPNGSSCGGTITVCNAPNSACPQSLGGGCCIPNYICAGVGCVINVVITMVVTQTPSTSTALTPSTSTSSTTSIRTSTTTTTVIPPVVVPTSVTGGGTQTTLACRSDSNPCPISLGGGCCHTDRVCASSMQCALSLESSESTTTTTENPSSTASTTVTGGAPVRPTSDDVTTTTGPILTTDCPVYFYACSARYGGGCCQTGRDCAVTSCPPTSSTTIISEGRTVVVPVGPAATVNTPTGACAPSWSSCAATLGGNCCPEGWQCGTVSCSTAGPSGTAVEQKQSPNAGGLIKVSRRLSIVGVVIVVMETIL